MTPFPDETRPELLAAVSGLQIAAGIGRVGDYVRYSGYPPPPSRQAPPMELREQVVWAVSNPPTQAGVQAIGRKSASERAPRATLMRLARRVSRAIPPPKPPVYPLYTPSKPLVIPFY